MKQEELIEILEKARKDDEEQFLKDIQSILEYFSKLPDSDFKNRLYSGFADFYKTILAKNL